MEAFDSNATALFALTTGLATAMIWLAARMRALELRDTHRRCPACGVVSRRGRPCSCGR
jgi:hypothetical protein